MSLLFEVEVDSMTVVSIDVLLLSRDQCNENYQASFDVVKGDIQFMPSRNALNSIMFLVKTIMFQ